MKSKKQHQSHLKVNRENSQTLKTDKMEKNKWKIKLLKDTKQKRMLTHNDLMENAASEEELRKNQESNTEICGKKIKTCEKSKGKQQNSEQNKEENEQMIKYIKQYEEFDRKDSNSGVSRTKTSENETNIHKKLKDILQTAYHISKTRKESRDKDGGSADERKAYQMKEKATTGRMKENIIITVKMTVRMNQK